MTFASPSPIRRSSQLVTDSPQFVELNKFIRELDNQKSRKVEIQESDLTKLQNLTDNLLNVVNPENRNDVLPLLSRSFSILSNEVPLEKMILDDSDELNAENEAEKPKPKAQPSEKTKEIIKKLQSEYNEVIEQLKRKLSLKVLKIIQQNEEILSLNNQINEKDELIEKYTTKISKLEDLIYDTDQKVQNLTKQLEAAKNAQTATQACVSELEALKEENKMLQSQNDDLLKLIDTIREEYSSLADQITTATKQKQKLSNCLFKLQSVCEKLSNNQPIQEKMQNNTQNTQSLDEVLAKIGNRTENDKIKEILNSNSSQNEKLSSVVDVLLESTQNTHNDESYEKLSNIIYSQLRFMNDIINRENVRTILIGPSQNEELYSIVASSCQLVQSFLNENNIALTHESSQFADLINMDMKDKISDDLSQYLYMMNENISIPEKERMTLVLQLATANNVLRRYCQEAKNVVEKIANDYKSLKKKPAEEQKKEQTSEEKAPTIQQKSPLFQQKSSTKQQKSPINQQKSPVNQQKPLQQQTPSDQNSNDEKLQKTLRLLLKCKKLNGNKEIMNAINEIASYISGDVELSNDDIYILKLENRIQTQKAKFSDLAKKYEQIAVDLEASIKNTNEKLEQSNNEVLSLREQLENMQQEREIEQQNHENEKLQLNKQIAKSKTEIKNQKDLSAKLKDEVQAYKRNIRENILSTLSSLKDYVSQLREEMDSVKEFAKTIFNVNFNNVEKAMEFIQKSFDNVTSEQNKVQQNLQKQIEKCKEESLSLKNEVDRAVSYAGYSEENVSQVNQKLKAAEMKIKNLENKAKSDIALLQKQHEFQISSNNAVMNKKIDEIREENQRKVLEICAKVCRGFREFYDTTLPISEETVDRIITSVNSRLSSIKESQNKHKANEEELDKIKKMIPVTGTSISDSVMKLTNELENMKKAVKNLNAEKDKNKFDSAMLNKYKEAYLTLKDWEIWGRRLFSSIFVGKNESSLASIEIRRQIEEYLAKSHEKASNTQVGTVQNAFAKYILT